MTDELKPLPCPFCGDSAFLYPDGDMEGHSVMCRGVADPNCASNAFGYSSEADAIAAWNRRAQPAAQALPAITEQQSKWGRLYTAANALVVQMGYRGSMQADSIEMESLKDKLHDLDGGEWMPGLMPPAQPVAPAEVTVLPDGSAFATASFPLPKNHWLYAPRGEWDSARDEYTECPVPILTNAQKSDVIVAARYAIRGATMCGQEQDFDPDAMVQNIVYALCGPATGLVLPADAAPSVAPEPPSEKKPYGDLRNAKWLDPACYAHGACQSLVFKAAHPPRAPLTEEQIASIVLRTVYEGDASTPYRDAWAAEIGVPFARAIEAAHGIRGQG